MALSTVEDRAIHIKNPIVARQFYVETYSEAETLKLCKSCAFTPPSLNDLREQLEHTAAIYRWEKSKYADHLASNKQRKELASVQKAAKKLGDAIDNLSWQPQSAITKHSENRSMAAFFGQPDGDEAATALISVPDPDGSEGHIEIDIPTLTTLIRSLEHTAKDAMHGLSKSRPGKQSSHALSLWVSNIADIWEQSTDQPFTRDVASDGEPITNAARFCVGAFQFIDPALERSLVLTTMKSCITRRKKRTG